MLVLAEGESSTDHFNVALLKLTLDGHDATLRIDPFNIPSKLLLEDAGTQSFCTATELEALGRDEWAALRARLRERLSQPIKLRISSLNQPAETCADFFGIGSTDPSAGGECLISPAVLDGSDAFEDGDWILKLTARGSLAYRYELINGKPLTGGATLKFDVTVTKQDVVHIVDAVRAVFAVDLPKLPGFDLQLRFQMPQLGFDFPTFMLSEAWLPSFFNMALPSFDSQLSFKLQDPKPQISLQVASVESPWRPALKDKANWSTLMREVALLW